MRNKTSVTQTPSLQGGNPRVDFDKDAFDVLIQQKGYDVFLEKGMHCPCRSKDTGSAQLPSCHNCGGSGFIFINKTRTRMVLKSMNLSTKYKEWSKENAGTVSITARDIERLSFMDRITLIDAETTFNQLIYPKLTEDGTILYAYTIYDIKEIIDIFLFIGAGVKLKRLVENTDYTYENNILRLNDSYKVVMNPQISIKYVHAPQFHVIDNVRDTINTFEIVGGKEVSVKLPINAVGRRSHYVLDAENYIDDRVFDNSYNINMCE